VIRIEITIYAVLALIGAVILTLICLTIVVARKFASPSSRSENLPDVIRIVTPVQSRRNKNPVTKVSRLSKAVFPNRRANKEPQSAKTNNPKQRSRPPLPPPVNLLRKS
jgi:ABC-type anion transport system duplicated permease subunit